MTTHPATRSPPRRLAAKDRQRGVYQPFILIMQVLALVLIGLAHRAGAKPGGIDLMTLAFVPGALLGTWCGIAIFRRFSDLQFARAVNLLLIASGLGFLWCSIDKINRRAGRH